MLLTNEKYSKDDIVTFKLSNGDEVIAKIVQDADVAFVVSKPCTVMPSQQGIGLIQSLFTGDLDKNISIDKRHIMMSAQTIQDIQSHYLKTTTGIDLAPAGKIIT
jgi:hypothetical protein